MLEHQGSPTLFRLAVSEIFKSLRLELVPRHRRSVPPVLFLQHREPGTGSFSIESYPLEHRLRESWPRIIALQVADRETLWWAVSLEVRLRQQERPGDPHDEAPDISYWLVVLLLSPTGRQAWWARIGRDARGIIFDIGDEVPMPPGEVREQVFASVGDRFYPLDA